MIFELEIVHNLREAFIDEGRGYGQEMITE